MRRLSRTASRRLAAALALVSALAGSAALAQYRPPPLTESQRLVQEGDAAQVAASAAITSGNKKGAEEKYRKAMELYEQALATDPTRWPPPRAWAPWPTRCRTTPAWWRSCSRC